MKKMVTLTGLALASLALLAACGTKSADKESKKETVYLATVGTTNPFSYQDKEGNLTGYDIEVAKAVFKDSDKYQVEYKKTAWLGIFAGLDSDKYQMGANNISYTDERAKSYLYSAPIASNPMVMAVPKDSDIKKYEDISGHSTQVIQGTTSASQLEEFNEAHKENPTQLNYTSEDIAPMLRSVNDGKFDYKIFDKIAVNSIIKSQGLDNLKVIELDNTQQPYVYFIFGKEQKELQEFVNKRIKELYEDGTLEELSQKYLEGSYLPEAKDMK